MIFSAKALLFYNNTILLLKPVDKSGGEWDIPGGTINKNETIYEALQREIQEETGISINKAVPITIVQREHNDTHYIIFICISNTNKITLSSEHYDYTWVTLKQLKKLLHYDIKSLLTQHVLFLNKCIRKSNYKNDK